MNTNHKESKKQRPGVHSKSKSSKLKSSKLYKKTYKGQGR
jgi:hypothetical protein